MTEGWQYTLRFASFILW